MTRSGDHQRLDRISAEQSGLFTRRQVRDCGFSDEQIRRRVRIGDWQVVLGKVLVRGGRVVTARLLDRAAQLAVPGAVLCGPSAARRYGLDPLDGRTWLTVAADRRVRLDGVEVRRAALRDDEVTMVDGLLLTRPAGTVVDCVRLLPPDAADVLLDRAIQQRLITFDEFVSRVGGEVGRPGVRALVGAVRRHALGARSTAERLLVGELRRRRVRGWRANLSVFDADGLIGEVDLGFEEVKLAVEVDGRAWHSSGDRFQHDRTRQNRLVRAGWTVLRFTWHDLRDMDRVTEMITDMVHRLRRDQPGSRRAPRAYD
ncbi:type IV toxin-antitoxin system AbiEi family antitoxin domain-containing protein [Catellatospora tritici]|uniref:type IV toxin-antitoxin system AbiEi family antitoxin domain-containing protein n=1 Tax=Catellatospora tritici TaxID=2851566 RepID=UPI001C2D29A1|nr:type IV toxin-antitoxin system AbiEi family antitoxin domain-containing protein [Catellatospora tritici]MBV1851930.1 endonuclease domain-containing protein [Catellatospora tritici]